MKNGTISNIRFTNLRGKFDFKVLSAAILSISRSDQARFASEFLTIFKLDSN